MYEAVAIEKLEFPEDYKIRVTFVNGVVGILDMTEFVFDGDFEPFKDPEKFKTAYINESRTIAWSSFTDLANDRIHYDICTSKDGVCKLI